MANLPEREEISIAVENQPINTREELAKMADVSDKTVERYKKIQQDAQVPAYGNARGIHGLLLFHSPIFEPPLHAK